MTTTYTTRQGETVDLACRAHYGRTAGVTEAVLAANPGTAELGPILPIGTRLSMPIIEARPTPAVLPKLWD